MESVYEVLGLKHSNPRITVEQDNTSNLAIVHYTNLATHPDDLKQRGTVIDPKDKMVLASSFGYTPVIITDRLERGMCTLTDTTGQTHTIDMNTLKFRMGREGVVIKVFKHNGKVYLSSHKKVDVSKSNLGNSITFDKMYKNLGGPTDELFDPEADYSPYCHTFIVSHRDLLIASRINMIGCEGYLYYLGCKKMWETAPTTWVKVEKEPRTPTCEITTRILESDFIPLDAANHHLKYGWHPAEPCNVDPRLWSGEFVIGYDEANDRWYRFESTSYNFRLNLREKETNLRHGFYKHLTLALKASKRNATEHLEQYNKIFPTIANVDPTSIYSSVRSKGYIVSWPRDQQTGRCNLVYNTWACYLLACPLHLQSEAAGFYNDYYTTCNHCCNAICGIWSKTHELKSSDNRHGLEQIAKKRIDDIIRQSQSHGVGVTGVNLDITFRSNCKNLISKEHGATLYAIDLYLSRYLATK